MFRTETIIYSILKTKTRLILKTIWYKWITLDFGQIQQDKWKFLTQILSKLTNKVIYWSNKEKKMIQLWGFKITISKGLLNIAKDSWTWCNKIHHKFSIMVAHNKLLVWKVVRNSSEAQILDLGYYHRSQIKIHKICHCLHSN